MGISESMGGFGTRWNILAPLGTIWNTLVLNLMGGFHGDSPSLRISLTGLLFLLFLVLFG